MANQIIKKPFPFRLVTYYIDGDVYVWWCDRCGSKFSVTGGPYDMLEYLYSRFGNKIYTISIGYRAVKEVHSSIDYLLKACPNIFRLIAPEELANKCPCCGAKIKDENAKNNVPGYVHKIYWKDTPEKTLSWEDDVEIEKPVHKRRREKTSIKQWLNDMFKNK